jgi:vacuole membrane protein 1
MNWQQLLQDDGAVTPQQISDFDHHRKELREELTLFRNPIQTLNSFFKGATTVCLQATRYCLSHSVFLFLLLPLSVAWFILSHVPGPHTSFIENSQFIVEYVFWWVGLGVLSSIGLGSGLQSGVLFLFPHVIKICLAAQSCGSMDFESETDIWFRSPPNLFKCPDSSSPATTVTFFAVWCRIIVPCFLQSAGTAIGEIPPYWMTRAARLAALQSGTYESEDIPEELETNSQYGVINKVKEFTVWFLQQHGFYGVLLMASYPNIAFDLCGICCGHFLMPFWTFFIATFLGKAVIRNAYQSVIYVMLCRY